jgi:hypothetical protein
MTGPEGTRTDEPDLGEEEFMAKDPSGDRTPDERDVDENELRGMKVDELRQRAKEEGVRATSSMRKDELVEAVSDAEGGSAAGGQGGGSGEQGDAGPEGGRMRTGPASSSSLAYSQEITSPEDEPERPGRSLVTTSHEVIRQWAEERGAAPATVEGTEHGDHLGVLRFDFGGGAEGLRQVGWEEWFATFDARRLNFLYQEQRKDERQSNFFQLENPEREDA